MKRLLFLTSTLLLVCLGVTTGILTLGHVAIGWPFNFYGFQALPDKVLPADSNTVDPDVFPPKVGEFDRAFFGIGNAQNGRTLYSWTAQYKPPSGDLLRDSVFVTATQYSEAAEAFLAINPSDWRLHSATTNIFYALSPVPYVFHATDSDYQAYKLEFVDGRWDVKIDCTNDQNLIAFVNQYRH